MKKPLLSGLEWQLLELLQADSRKSISDLAKQLNRSRSTIADHIRQLQENGVLTRFSIQVSEEKLGFGLSAFVRLQASSEQHREIVATVDEIPEVAECHVLTGTDLLMMRIVARDMPHLRDIVDGLTQYGSTVTDVIFSTVKQTAKIDPRLRRSTEH